MKVLNASDIVEDDYDDDLSTTVGTEIRDDLSLSSGGTSYRSADDETKTTSNSRAQKVKPSLGLGKKKTAGMTSRVSKLKCYRCYKNHPKALLTFFLLFWFSSNLDLIEVNQDGLSAYCERVAAASLFSSSQ